MKKILFICIALFALSIQGNAQKYLNIYQEDLVIKRLPTSEVDSISVTEAEPATINLWYDGNVFLSFSSEEVDSLKVIDEGGDPFSYIGIVGFNDELYKKESGVISHRTKDSFDSFIDNLPQKDGTLLYYAVDNALDMIDNSIIKTPLSNINLVTFTDGLDQGSIMLEPDYNTSGNYLNTLTNRIQEINKNDLPIEAYTVGLRGNDVSNLEMFKKNLVSLASSEENAFEIKSMSELRSQLQKIANKIISINTRQTISVRVQGNDSGTKFRFIFDGKTPEKSQLYIEGTFNLQDLSLYDVTYHGIRARSGSTIQGTKEGTAHVTYTFRGLRQEDGIRQIPTEDIKHYYLQPSSSAWQINSEFKPNSSTQKIVNYTGASIVLVLDCSSSLGYDFRDMKSYAKEFVNMVSNNAMPFDLEAPKNVQANMDSVEFAINVSWDKVRNSEYYNVYRSSSNYYSNYTLIADSISQTSWKDLSPMSGNNYYRIRALGYGLTSSESSTSNNVSCSLSAPSNVKSGLAVEDSKLCIMVSWDAVKYAEYYKVYRRKNGSSSNYELIADSIRSTSWMDKSPLSGDNYYKVYAVYHDITSSESNYTSISYSLSAPTNVRAELDSLQLAIKLTWDAVGYAQYYNVYRSSSNYYYYSNYTLIADSISQTSWKDLSPMSGSNYYRIRALGYGLTSNESSTSNNVSCSLSAPSNVKSELAVEGSILGIKVSWDAVKYAEYYKIYRSKNVSSSNYGLIADSIRSTSWMDKIPLSGDNYYKVYAVYHDITSSESSYTSINYNTPLSAPTNVRAELDSLQMTINVTWDVVEYAQYYNVYHCNNKYGSDYTLVAEAITSPSWKDLSPKEGSNYYSICAVGYGFTSEMSSKTNVIRIGEPSYTELLYLERNSNYKGQFEDLGVKLKDNTKIQIKLKPSNGGGGAIVYEINAPSDKDDYRFFWYNNSIYYDYGGDGGSVGRRMHTHLPTNKLYELEIGNYYIKHLNGEDILRGTTLNGVATSHERTLAIAGDTDYFQLYYLKIYEEDELVKDYIPVIEKETNEVTLYDKVSGTFLTPKGLFTGSVE